MNTKEVITALKQDTGYLKHLEEEQELLKDLKVEGNDLVSWKDYTTEIEKLDTSILKQVIKLGIEDNIIINNKAILETIQNIEKLTNEFNNTSA